MSQTEEQVQCTRCRHQHKHAARLVHVGAAGNGMDALVCPRCRCWTYFDIRPQAAWCWSSGLIEIGDETEMPIDAILVARGPNAFLIGTIGALARSGRGASDGKYLVPGIPEADGQQAKGDALAKWLMWCASRNGHKDRHGVVFAMPND